MKKILFIACLMAGLISCNHNRDTRTTAVTPADTVDIHTAENSLDYYGSYKGVLPSGSGEGIETLLILRGDKQYILQTVYVSHKENRFEDKGEYTVEGNLLTLKNQPEGSQYYRIGENKLTKLDNDRQLITGALADQYVLRKTN